MLRFIQDVRSSISTMSNKEQLNKRVKEYLLASFDAVQQQELLRQLHDLAEEDRFDVVLKIIELDVTLGLTLARKSLSKPKYFEAILLKGIEQQEKSDIKLWLNCVFAPMGFKRVYSLLRREKKVDWRRVAGTLPVLPMFFNPNSVSQRSMYRDLLIDIYHHAEREGAASVWLQAQVKEWE